MSITAKNKEKKRDMLVKAQIVFDLCIKIINGVKLEDLDMSELDEVDKKKVMKCYKENYKGGFTL